MLCLGIPVWLSGKEYACNAGDLGLIPGLGTSLAEENGNPLEYCCLGNTMDREVWRAKVTGSQRVRHQHSHWACTHMRNALLKISQSVLGWKDTQRNQQREKRTEVKSRGNQAQISTSLHWRHTDRHRTSTIKLRQHTWPVVYQGRWLETQGFYWEITTEVLFPQHLIIFQTLKRESINHIVCINKLGRVN